MKGHWRIRVLGKLVIRIAVEPALPRLGRRDDRMPGRARVLRGMAVRRVVATVRAAALLTGTQMNPRAADLDALLALMPFRPFDSRDRIDVGAGLVGHDVGYWRSA